MIESATHIADVAQSWRLVDPDGSVLTTPEWLATDEEGRAGPRRYLVQRSGPDGRPVGALAAYRIEAGEFPTYDPVALLLSPLTEPRAADPHDVQRIRGGQEELTREREALYPAAACMLPGAYLPGVVGRDAAVDVLLDRFEELAREWGCRTSAVLHVPEDDRRLRAALEARGYVGASFVAQAVLPVAWSSFDDYLATLRRNRRTSIRRERRVFAESGMRVRRVSVESAGPAMAALHAAQLRRYGHDIAEERLAALIERIRRHLAPWCTVLVAERDGELEGFVLAYEKSGELHPKMTGFSKYAQQHFGYFNLLYYEVLEYAMARGVRSVVLGPETYEAKVARGALLHPRTTYLRVPERFREQVSCMTSTIDRLNHQRFRQFVADQGPVRWGGEMAER
ncbi:GNAT family N-acetyltransferase [Carbonactinospora thermoautotrophica]|uniref:GNAT family N-acetyltransferase n=1 Tax=Carbonactinospora thermoautotrophica TaxID=1469144 RepID=UPI0022709774|nr:GNAT family N-acetyltransferase [Carbonactinospora thermoautotrophica]